MQGDMDIVDPLIDDYLTRLAGSPDPVAAEMRRYADERAGFPIGGRVLGDTVLRGGGVARGASGAATAGLREYTRLRFGSAGLVSTTVPTRGGLALTLER